MNCGLLDLGELSQSATPPGNLRPIRLGTPGFSVWLGPINQELFVLLLEIG
mgnify:CR=1